MPSSPAGRRYLTAATLFFVATFAVGVYVPSAADHSAAERHVEADHGSHDAHVVTVDQRTEWRSASQALPAAPSLYVDLPLAQDAAPLEASVRLVSYPPPRRAPARSPPPSV